MHTTLISLLAVLGAAEPAPATPPSPPPMVEAATPAPTNPTASATEAAPAATPAAANNMAHRIILKDGQELRGRITSETADSVVLELFSGGRVELARASVDKIVTEEITIGRGGEAWFIDPNRSRYLYAPSAMMLGKGECYFSQKELLFSAMGCGVHENITVLFGTIVPAWFMVPTSGYGMNAIAAVKVGTPVNDFFHVAGGFETLVIPMSGNVFTAGFVFGSATVGNSNAHATISLGRPFAFSGLSQSMFGDAIIVVAGDYRLSPNFALVSENWVMPFLNRAPTSLAPTMFMINGLAARFLGPKWTVDAGLIRMHDYQIPIPWLDFTYNFG